MGPEGTAPRGTEGGFGLADLPQTPVPGDDAGDLHHHL